MVWTIEYTETAKKALRKLDKQTARQLLEFMEKQVAPLGNPRTRGKPLSGPLGALWRYRVGEYRLICDIEDEEIRVLVVKIGHRREVYR